MKIINGTERQYEILLQQAQRESMILKLLADIRTDMVVCELMDINRMEYLKILKDEIGHLYKEDLYKNQKHKNIGRLK